MTTLPRKTYSAEGMALYWWDDALAIAHQLASETGERHRVFRGAHGWTVAPVSFRRRLQVVG